MKNLTFKRIMSFVVIVAMMLSILAVSAVADGETKFDLVIEGPETFAPGDEIEVFVKVKNITATDGTLNGLTSIEGTLWYDNSRMVLTNDLDEDSENANAVMCVETVPSARWSNATMTDYTFNEDEYVATPKNSGQIKISLFSQTIRQQPCATEDDSIVLKFTFTVNNTAYGNIDLFFDTDVTGTTDVTTCDGKGSELTITDPNYVPPTPSEDVSEETSEPEGPDYAYIDIDRVNVYGGANEICAWTGEDE
ncbi:MAG: hypothetical protein IKC39_04910, partial [Clostridia bacterium]|nr:hypothetical protein [Clostridia bacterium]